MGSLFKEARKGAKKGAKPSKKTTPLGDPEAARRYGITHYIKRDGE
jgi:hypothetical protein